MAALRILLADDHTVVRQGLRKVLEERPEWQVVAEAGDGREAVRLAEQHKPDVAVLDVAMPLLNGIEATRQIAQARAAAPRVLVLSMYSDEAYVTQILKAGATGYLLKDSADVDLLQAVSAVSQGKSFFSPAVARLMLDDYVRPARRERRRIATNRCRTASARSSSSLPKARPTRKSPRCCSSARARWRPTARGSWRSSTSTAPRRSCSTRSDAA